MRERVREVAMGVVEGLTRGLTNKRCSELRVNARASAWEGEAARENAKEKSGTE